MQELIPKHLTRLLNGRPTTGPGETLFLNFYSARIEIQDLIRPDTVFKKFGFEDYHETPIGELANRTRIWAEQELRLGSFSRGDYRWIQGVLSLHMMPFDQVSSQIGVLGSNIPGFKVERSKKVISDKKMALFLIILLQNIR